MKIYNLFVLLLKLIDSLQCLISMVISFDLKLFELFPKIPISKFMLLNMNFETLNLCFKGVMFINLTHVNKGLKQRTRWKHVTKTWKPNQRSYIWFKTYITLKEVVFINDKTSRILHELYTLFNIFNGMLFTHDIVAPHP
jgi:hypothetical protein